MAQSNELAKRLAGDGFVVLPGLLSGRALTQAQRYYGGRVVRQCQSTSRWEGFARLSYRDGAAARLMVYPPLLATLAELGLADCKLHSCYASVKWPQSEALFWHRDVFYPWAETRAPEVFVIYALGDTTVANGCLRVVPGSHLEVAARNWAMEQRRALQDPKPRRDLSLDAVDVPLRAGDVVVGDRRLLHATYGNATAEARVCVTVAYAVGFAGLPEQVQAMIVANPCLPEPGWWRRPRAGWWLEESLRSLLPVYEGRARAFRAD